MATKMLSGYRGWFAIRRANDTSDEPSAAHKVKARRHIRKTDKPGDQVTRLAATILLGLEYVKINLLQAVETSSAF
jgi:hypothetical protein